MKRKSSRKKQVIRRRAQVESVGGEVSAEVCSVSEEGVNLVRGEGIADCREDVRGKDWVLFWWLVPLVMALVAAVHWPALEAQALSFDDSQYLVDNILVRNPGWPSAQQFLEEVSAPSTVRGYYQPLTMISLMLDYARGGRPEDLRAFHVTSLFLHVMNVGLVMIILMLLFRSVWPAVLTCLLFGLHPLTVETIPWVSERKTLLASFFFFWALIFYLRYVRRQGWIAYGAALFCFALSLMAKPTGTPFPVLLLLLDYWPLRRLHLYPLKRIDWRLLGEKVPFLLIASLSAYITVISQAGTSSLTSATELSAENRFYVPMVLCHNIVFYLYKVVWPVNLSSHYPVPSPDAPMVMIGYIGTIIWIILLLVSWRRTRAVITGWLFFFIAIFPTLGVVSRFSNVIASDKYAYLPSLGFLMMVGWALDQLWRWRPFGRFPNLIRGMTVGGVLLLATVESMGVRDYLKTWRDTETHCRHMLTLAPNAAILHFTLGTELGKQGRIEEAVACYRRTLELNPGFLMAHGNLGIILMNAGESDQALEHFQKVLASTPDDFRALNNVGNLFRNKGELEEAIRYYEEALKISPNQPDIYLNLAASQFTVGHIDEAIAHWRTGLKLKPLEQRAAIYNDVAWLLATDPRRQARRPTIALEFAEEASRLSNEGNPIYLITLAAAYVGLERFDEAIEQSERALQLALEAGDNALAEKIRPHLEFYRAHGSFPMTSP